VTFVSAYPHVEGVQEFLTFGHPQQIEKQGQISSQFQNGYASSPSWIHGCEPGFNNIGTKIGQLTSQGSNVSSNGSHNILATTSNT
jgi:hypothetical protein